MKEEDDKGINEIIERLKELIGDTSVPKNIKENIERVIKTLNDKSELSIRVSKVLSELDEISDDMNMQPYTRTQIWNIVSMLEKMIY
jgi:uncharacterized protein (UPF0147 family)